MEGFTYRGIHCSSYGCYYIPSESNMGTRMEEYKVDSIEIEGKDGGYYYGSTVSPRVFQLECFFENINDYTLNQIYEWLRRDQSGEQIFDERPYVAYTVYPSKKIELKLYSGDKGVDSSYSGTLAIYFTAYKPFGRMLINAYDAIDYVGASNYSGVIEINKMPVSPNVNSKQFLMYNCGTEQADTIIRISGTVDANNGLVITNTTNGTSCKIVQLKASSLVEGAYLEIDSAMGQVRKVVGGVITMAFEYHDLGYIKLAPCTPIKRNAIVDYSSGSRSISSAIGEFTNDMKGQYIYLNNDWRYISQVVNPYSILVNANMLSDGLETTEIVTMNTIVLSAGSTLTKFEVACTPTMR